MQKFLTACAFVTMTATAALAAAQPSVADSVGQPVYDVRNMKIGVIAGETKETGTPSAIVALTGAGGNRQVLIAEESIQPKSDGGWLTALDSAAIGQLQPYVPLKPPPA